MGAFELTFPTHHNQRGDGHGGFGVLCATSPSKKVPWTLKACMASATRNRCSSEAIQMTFLLKWETRSSVSCSKLLLPMSDTDCLETLLRLSAQSHVPEPPRRITGVIIQAPY